MKAIAEELGWEELYSVSEPFRERFDEMCKAVEQLPEPLIERGRELGYPQLHWACVAGDVDLVEALLKNGLAADAYTFTEDDTDEPPLVWLAQDGELSVSRKIEIAKVLLSYGADINEGSALAVALEAGDDEFAQFLQASGVAG